MSSMLLFLLQAFQIVSNFFYMPQCQTVQHLVSPVPDWKTGTMPEPVRFRNKGTQSGTRMVWYQTEMSDAGMMMPPALSLNP
jgi:hypothetical protein